MDFFSVEIEDSIISRTFHFGVTVESTVHSGTASSHVLLLRALQHWDPHLHVHPGTASSHVLLLRILQPAAAKSAAKNLLRTTEGGEES